MVLEMEIWNCIQINLFQLHLQNQLSLISRNLEFIWSFTSFMNMLTLSTEQILLCIERHQLAVQYTIAGFHILPKNMLVKTAIILPLIHKALLFTILCSRKLLNSSNYETKDEVLIKYVLLNFLWFISHII